MFNGILGRRERGHLDTSTDIQLRLKAMPPCGSLSARFHRQVLVRSFPRHLAGPHTSNTLPQEKHTVLQSNYNETKNTRMMLAASYSPLTSTIAARRLNCWVRNETRCTPPAKPPTSYARFAYKRICKRTNVNCDTHNSAQETWTY